MGCKSCERDAIKIYSEISKGTGVNYFYYHNEGGNQIIIPESSIQTLQSNGSLPVDVELTLI